MTLNNKSQSKTEPIASRLFVVDQSMGFRSILRKAIGNQPGLDIVGSAGSYEHAVDSIKQLNPSVILLELPSIRSEITEQIDELKKMNESIKFIVSIPKKFSTSSIIKLTGLTGDVCWRKEFDDEHPTEINCQGSISELLKRIKSLVGGAANTGSISSASIQPIATARNTSARIEAIEVSPRTTAVRSIDSNTAFGLNRFWRPELIAIGSSTGGPDALTQIVGKLDRSLDFPIVIAQHMPANFTEQLANRLSAHGKTPAIQAEHGMILECGKIYIAPGDYHLEVCRDKLNLKAVLHQGPKVNSCRPAVDVLFNSVATTLNRGALALVLTGMGRDGEDGCKMIRQHGGQVWIQDEATSVIWGMPGAVAKAGYANRELPLNKISDEINSLVRSQPRLREVSAET